MIQFVNASKTFANGTVGIEKINLKIEDGDFVYLVGVSGAGKSTLTRLLIREYKVTEGSILVDGKDIGKLRRRQVAHYRRRIGFVFQDFRLLGDRTAFENVAFAGECIGLSPVQVKAKAKEALAFVGLAHRANHLPAELSGGEAQRVAIARAILNKPDIVIADEPTGNLDPGTAQEILALFEDLHASGKTIIMATHDQNLVNHHVHRVVTMEDGRFVSDSREGRYHLGQSQPAGL